MTFKPTKKDRELQAKMEKRPEDYDLLLRTGNMTQEAYDAMQEYRPGRSKGRPLTPEDEGWQPELELPPVQQATPSAPRPLTKLEMRQVVREAVREVLDGYVFPNPPPPVKRRKFWWFLLAGMTPLLKAIQYYIGSWWIPEILVATPAIVVGIAVLIMISQNKVGGSYEYSKTSR